MRLFVASAIALLALTSAASAQSGKATLKDAGGKDVGSAQLSQTPHGVLVRLTLKGVPAGEHAFHIHQTGKCEPPFETAGGHYNPAKRHHGFAHAQGAHAGDLPNVHVPDSGNVTVEMVAREVRLREGAAPLQDADGSALVLHAGADDYQSDPAGGAGDRIACGVIDSRP